MPRSTALYSVAQVRAFDAHAIHEGIPGYTLMQRAGTAALGVLRKRWPEARQLVVVCGGGNNGGDGYVLARLALKAGFGVRVLAVSDPQRLGGDARRAAEDFLASTGRIEAWTTAPMAAADVVVDAILGTGVRAPLHGSQAEAIAAINASGTPVLALDLPSGLDGDSGAMIGDAVHASCTVTFIALKQGLFLGDGPAHSGTVILEDLGVELPAGMDSIPVLSRLNDADVGLALPRRRCDAHKGDFGRVLIVGGGPGMPGAVRLAGEACLRVGAGLVTVATLPEHAVALAAARPELICIGAPDARSINAQLASATVIAIGPGLGQSDWARGMLDAALAAGRPLVIDADALNLMAVSGVTFPAGSIITPHPGEAARLLKCTASAIQSDRVGALSRLAQTPGVVAVLKGASTLVGSYGLVSGVCEFGNPAMAVAGMGDVLTGAIAGVYAQCRDAWLAARAGVLLHARAGDYVAARVGDRGLLALDVAAALPLGIRGAPS